MPTDVFKYFSKSSCVDAEKSLKTLKHLQCASLQRNSLNKFSYKLGITSPTPYDQRIFRRSILLFHRSISISQYFFLTFNTASLYSVFSCITSNVVSISLYGISFSQSDTPSNTLSNSFTNISS